jgi:hypothetical protein
MSVVVLSNCQTYGLAEAMRLVLGASEVSAYDASLLLGTDRQQIRSAVEAAEVVFAMRFPPFFEEFSAHELPKICRRLVVIPSFDFAGFHPDMIYVANAHKWVQSPTGDYNSNICLAGFLRGFSPRRTADLFNAYTFAKIGYFKAFEDEKRTAIGRFAEVGINIAPLFTKWSEYGKPFMYSGNHPHPFVLADIAAAACNIAQLTNRDTFVDYEKLSDRLQHSHILPVFPELADALRVEGSKDFKIATRENHRVVPLEEYVSECFRNYADADMANWSIPERTKSTAQLFSTWI